MAEFEEARYIRSTEETDICGVCGERQLIGPPITPGSNRSVMCPNLKYDWHKEASADINKQNKTLHLQWARKIQTYEIPKEAKRNPTSVRYDILDPDFLKSLAQIAHYGAEKYGDLNWHKSRLEGDKGCINHIYKHLGAYRNAEPYDHQELGQSRKWHLAAIAFNAMMEFWYENQEDDSTIYKSNP